MNFIKNKHQITMDVLCITQYKTYYLAGIGNYLFVYENGSLCTSQAIFLNERVHNIYGSNDNSVFVKGGKQLALVKLEKINDVLNCKISMTIHCSDWIQDVVVLGVDNSLIGLVTAHNLFEVWDINLTKKINSKRCDENCILYCCKCLGSSSDDVIIFCGTAFGEIIIWNPFVQNQEETLLQRFEAHNGAVFSIEISIEQKVMTSTSDDRSLRIWKIDANESLRKANVWKSAVITLQHTLFGHTARVWRSLIVSQYYVTISEDSNLIIWKNDGSLFRTKQLHQESGIRGLYYSEDQCEIITGGEDGGINAISWNSLIEDNKLIEKTIVAKDTSYVCIIRDRCVGYTYYIITEGENAKIEEISWLRPIVTNKLDSTCQNSGFSIKACFTENGFAFTTKEGIVAKKKSGDFSYQIYGVCVMEPSPCGFLIALGCTNGYSVLLDGLLNCLEKSKFSCPIVSIHWLGDRFPWKILVCDSMGCLSLYSHTKFDSNEPLIVFSLPKAKEHKINCALLVSRTLVVGDRMGNVYFFDIDYEVKSRDPFLSFPNFHGSLGVTDMMVDGKSIITIGRDGTIKTISLDYVNCMYGIHTSTNKLPMNWLGKIFKYNGDKLIVGFRSEFLLIWSVKHREIIASHKCGGGHRSCHYQLDGNKIKLLYVKRNKLCFVTLPLDGIKRLRPGFHGKMVNSLKILSTNPTLIVTGSEDTTMRISRLLESDVEVLETFKTHLSSIRAVATCIHEKNEILIFTAGGRAQLIIWRYFIRTSSYHQDFNYRLKEDDKKWKCYDPTNDPNSRFMCLDVCKSTEKEYLVVIGSSDRQIRLFSYEYQDIWMVKDEDNNNDNKLKLLCSVCYTHCILKIALLKVKESIYIVSMGNDGKVVFFQTSENLTVLKECNTFLLHQSGINSFAFKQIEPEKFIMFTGGDDNKISGSIVWFQENQVKLEEIWSNSNIHSCQVTGIEILDDVLLTTSTDQRITLWKMNCDNDGIRIEYKDQRLTSVPDVQGLNAYRCTDTTISAIVYGKGVETVKFHIET